MLALLSAMVSVIVTWAVLACAMAGIGLLVLGPLRPAPATVSGLHEAFWLGLALTLGGLVFWNIFLAIGVIPLAVVLVAGLVGFARSVRPVAKLASGALRHRRLTLMAGLLVIIWLANRAIGPADLWDTRMYHLNAVRWAREFAAIPGIANLERNIAFNNASHLLAAMLDVGPWHGRSQHLMSGLFLVALGLRAVLGLSRVLRGRDRVDDRFFALTLPVVVGLAMRPEAASLSTDLPAAVLTLTTLGLALALLSRGPDRRPRTALWVTILCLFAAAVACKLSTLGLALVGFPLFVLVPFVERYGWAPLRVFTLAGAVIIFFAVPWTVRSAIMSGYPLFPATSVAALDVEWRYPDDELRQLQQWIRAHGRGKTAEEWHSGKAQKDWFNRWAYTAITSDLDRAAGVAGLALGAVAASFAGRRKRRRPWLAIAPACSATAFWFATAPALRFGFAFPWAVAALALAILWPVGWTRAIIAMVILLCALPVGRTLVAGRRDPTTTVYKLIFLAGSDHGFHQPTPAAYTTFTSRFGVTVHVPVEGDFIWNAPLPSTHLRNPNLRLRVPGDLSKGFVDDRTSR
jgi:hypothetical protein